VTSPLTLFEPAAKLKDAQRLLEDYKAGKRPDLLGQDEVVWKAKQLVDSSCVHLAALRLTVAASIPTLASPCLCLFG